MLAKPPRLVCAFWFIPQKIFRCAPPPEMVCYRPWASKLAARRGTTSPGLFLPGFARARPSPPGFDWGSPRQKFRKKGKKPPIFAPGGLCFPTRHLVKYRQRHHFRPGPEGGCRCRMNIRSTLFRIRFYRRHARLNKRRSRILSGARAPQKAFLHSFRWWSAPENFLRDEPKSTGNPWWIAEHFWKIPWKILARYAA